MWTSNIYCGHWGWQRIFLYWRHYYRGNIWNISFFLLSSSVQVFRANHMRYDIMTVFLLQVPTCNRFSHAAWNTQRTIWRLISLFFLCHIILMLIYWRILLSLCLFSIHTTDSFFSLSFLLKFGTRSENSTTGKTVSKRLHTVAQHHFLFCMCCGAWKIYRGHWERTILKHLDLSDFVFYYKSHGTFLQISFLVFHILVTVVKVVSRYTSQKFGPTFHSFLWLLLYCTYIRIINSVYKIPDI